MAIIELRERDYIIHTEKKLFIENIKFNKEKWDNYILPCVTQFYFEFI